MPARRLRSEGPFVTLTVDGADVRAREGEPIAVALWAADRRVLGRSVKYHRARGAACFAGRCDGCLMRVDGSPSVRTCRTKARQGTVIETQNVIGSARLDLLEATDLVFAGGMNHHEMFTWSRPVNRIMQEVARRVAGVGTLPDEPCAPTDVERVACDVCVIGAGVAGLACAEAIGDQARVIVLDEEDTVHRSTRASVRTGTSAVGVFDETEGTRIVVADGDERALVVTPRMIVIAQGRAESVEAFGGNDLPGVISLDAAMRLLSRDVLPGERPIVVGEGAEVEGLIARLASAGATPTRIDRDELVRARGRSSVRLVETKGGALICDALIVRGRANACYELAAQAGVEVIFDGEVFDLVASRDDGATRHPRVLVAGSAAGVHGTAEASAHGERVAARVLEVLRDE